MAHEMQMTRDLMRHFNKQLVRLMLDTLNTCERVDMPHDERIAVAFGPLCTSLIRLAIIAEIDERELHKLIGDFYREAAALQQTGAQHDHP